MNNKIKSILLSLPSNPGCYLMKDEYQNIIYVGKAKNLKKRVNSYFTKTHNNKTQLLVKDIRDIEYIVTSSEKESLILEINLIKKHRPRYNVIFMDDKYYPYIQITNERHPRIKVVRNTKNKKATHFGPYPDSGAARDTLRIINKLFPLRKCNKIPKKECLYYHLNQCIAPCIFNVEPEDYTQIIKELKSFLNGNTSEIINGLSKKMYEASNEMNFEKAMEYRKMIDSIDITTNRQKVFKDDRKNRDYIGVAYNKDYISIQILIVRNGVLIERDGDIFALVDDVKATLESYLSQYYELNTIPNEVMIEQKYVTNLIKDLLEGSLRIPKIGDHKKMLNLSNENANKLLQQEYDLVNNNRSKRDDALHQLQELLDLPREIHRIEAFDNSTLQGSDSIGSMVVFENGLPVKSEYRKFKIRQTEIVDDYAFMREVIYRRYYRVLMDQLKRPDLIIVDGGIGQINVAKQILNDFRLDIKVIGLVKDDKHRTSFVIDDEQNKYNLDRRSELFFMLTRIQDEVHRYAITYHRSLRSKSMFTSVLDDVEGIGPARKQKLLKHFDTFKKLKAANVEELSEVVPPDVAQKLYDALKKDSE